MVTNTLSFYVVLLLLLVVVVIEVQPLPFIIIIIIMVLYNNHYCCFCCCCYFKFTFIYRLHLMPVVYHFLCFITTLKCIWNLLIWVNYTVKFYKHFRRLHSYICYETLKTLTPAEKRTITVTGSVFLTGPAGTVQFTVSPGSVVTHQKPLSVVIRLGFTYLRLKDNHMEILNREEEIERRVHNTRITH